MLWAERFLDGIRELADAILDCAQAVRLGQRTDGVAHLLKPRADRIQRRIDGVVALFEGLETRVEAIPTIVETMQCFFAREALDGAMELFELAAERLRVCLTAAFGEKAYAVVDTLEIIAHLL